MGAMTAGPRRSPSGPVGRVRTERGGILVAEDEFLIADDLAQAFAEAGARVVGPVASVEAALASIAGEARLGGVVLDVNLRGEMAFPVADELVRRGVPFLFATGYDAAAIPTRFARVPFCEKPVDVGRVVSFLLTQAGWTRAPRPGRFHARDDLGASAPPRLDRAP